MGGICGIVLGKGKIERSWVQSMVSSLGNQARGEEAIIDSRCIGVGAKSFLGRLSGVCHLREHSKEHMLAFHGSIYNMDEMFGNIRSEESVLQELLCLSLQGMKQLLLQLCGEFAIAFWDANQRTLFFACDRMRVHPLYYWQSQQALAFASRMRSILSCPILPNLTIDPSSIVEFVSQSFIPTPRTIFQEIKKLPPGNLLKWNQGEIQVEPYWDCSFLNPDQSNWSQLTADLKGHFADSVRVRANHGGFMKSTGSFLSGGIDSSTTLGVLSGLDGRKIKSFSIGFAEQTFNELEFARYAAHAFGSEHYEYIVTPKDTYDILPDIIESFDEPFGNASAVPTYCCARLAREQGVQVLFAGDGGDELFAGNQRYATQKTFDYYSVFPEWLRNYGIQPTVSILADMLNCQILRKGMKYIRRANIPYPDRLFSWGLFEVMPMNSIFSTSFIETLGKGYDPHASVRQLYQQAPAINELDRQLYIDLKSAIIDNDLFKVTRMTEVNEVVVHFPFLDHRLVEFAAQVPANMKMQGRELRTFFKQAYADILPEKVLKKVKHGFGLPIPIWLRTDKNLREMMMDLLTGNRLEQRGYFHPETIQELLAQHMIDHTSFYGTILWNLVILELWLQRYYDKH